MLFLATVRMQGNAVLVGREICMKAGSIWGPEYHSSCPVSRRNSMTWDDKRFKFRVLEVVGNGGKTKVADVKVAKNWFPS